MENQGWIKFHRKFINWEWYDDINTSRLFIHCLLKANHQDRKWRGITIKRSQFITSLNKLSDETGLTLQQVRTSINKLKKTKDLTSKPTNKYTLFTLDNYEKYQNNNTQVTTKKQTNNKQVTTNNNIKNKKNDKEYINNSVSTLKIRQADFYKQVLSQNKYPKEMLIAFYNYWSEPNKSGTKFLKELQKTWDLSRRLSRWANNDYSKNNTTTEYIDESKIEHQKRKERIERQIIEEKQNNSISDEEKQKILKLTNFKWQ
jgi:hypothetical protein